MKIKAIDGREFEITHEEAKRIAEMVSGGNVFKRNPEFTAKMHDFYSHYQHTAAQNIQKAVGANHPPMTEDDVKLAVAMAITHYSPEVAAEVIFEAAEWETAYANLKSLE
jgi:hypothetical protein